MKRCIASACQYAAGMGAGNGPVILGRNEQRGEEIMEDYNVYIFAEYPDVVGTDELCEMLGGISRRLVYRILREGQIPSLRIGRTYKIAKADVAAYILQHGERPQEE